uniref:Uncharacterized protein n=1 Tax=viral metagenome TaxID=1070528 RepID=A0A6M3J6D2_9ZZZZ
MPAIPPRLEQTLTIVAGATWICGSGGDVDLGRVIDKALVDNQTAADVTIYVGGNADLIEATNGKRALQLATGVGATLIGKRARLAIHNPHAATSATVGVVIDGGLEGNQAGGSYQYDPWPITCDIDYITCDTTRFTADATELR